MARSQAGFSTLGSHEDDSISRREAQNALGHVDLALPPNKGAQITVRHTAGLGVSAGQVSGGAFEHGYLHAEARAGRADRVGEMVRQRVGEERGHAGGYMYDVNAYDDNGMTPLHCAAGGGHVECCELLLELSALVNAPKLNSGLTPLHLACAGGHLAAVKFLILHAAAIDAASEIPGESGRVRGEKITPLMAATREGRGDVMRILLEGVQVKHTQVRCAVDLSNVTGQTALHIAAARGDTKLCALLVSFRANIQALDGMGETPLHHAVYSRSSDAVAFLLEKGADILAQASNGQTAMQQCATAIAALERASKRRDLTEDEAFQEGENILVMEVLIENGASIPDSDRHYVLGVPEELRAAIEINAQLARRKASMRDLL